MAEYNTLKAAAAALGLSPATLRWQILKGRLKAQKFGRDWLVEQAEVERYRREHKGRPGRRQRRS